MFNYKILYNFKHNQVLIQDYDKREKQWKHLNIFEKEVTLKTFLTIK